MDKIRQALTTNISLTDKEAQIFLFLTMHGKNTLGGVSDSIKFSEKETKQLLCSLIEKGLVMELSGGYQIFHPKFSIINAYRLHCKKTGVEFKKNIVIDNLASTIERIHESARTK